MSEKPNWWEPLMRAAEANGVEFRNAISIADIRHDDWCDRLNGRGVCNCDPNVTLTSRDLPSNE